MTDVYWDNPNPDLYCQCNHKLRYHTVRYYQDMQQITRLNGPSNMMYVGNPYEEWTCEGCNCNQWAVDNLRYLEHKATEKGI
jgi:hypothetical protein